MRAARLRQLQAATLAAHLARHNCERRPGQCGIDAVELCKIAQQHQRAPDYSIEHYAKRAYLTLQHYPGLRLRLRPGAYAVMGLSSHPDPEGYSLVLQPTIPTIVPHGT